LADRGIVVIMDYAPTLPANCSNDIGIPALLGGQPVQAICGFQRINWQVSQML